MKPPSKLILTAAAACGLLAAAPAMARDYGYDDDYRYGGGHHHHHHHHHSGGGYCYDRTTAWAQSILRDMGYYYGCVDGIMGSGTRSALIRYQCDHDLPHTGCLDSRTICMLREE